MQYTIENSAVIPKSVNMNQNKGKCNIKKKSPNFKGCKPLLPAAGGEVVQSSGHRNKALPGRFNHEITGNDFPPYMT